MRTAYGTRIASVIHLAAYFDLTGEPNPLYSEITVHCTEKLLRALQSFEVEQFVFASYSRWRRAALSLASSALTTPSLGFAICRSHKAYLTAILIPSE